ncbi:hypothetical protein WS62_12235 [Burkholderia sp. ABCPW 14]|uniref:hypothetical protein n=1 Tax=Burkholderia sp. ABCPW 14 TaxID=1637860 RepID=UPI000770CC7F|nr:hypothetical protein [Burkholderia sp. ABCPW 14]KVD70654.1 hypothetical protein WS62_12235 [Burkholderia sp. ABCPW 14]
MWRDAPGNGLHRFAISPSTSTDEFLERAHCIDETALTAASWSSTNADEFVRRIGAEDGAPDLSAWRTQCIDATDSMLESPLYAADCHIGGLVRQLHRFDSPVGDEMSVA